MPTYAELSREPAWGAEFAPPNLDALRSRIRARAVVADGDCWLWSLGLQANGYGRITVDQRRRLVHRVAYEAFVGPIPAGLDIDHLCRVRNCVNPAHLEVVTHQENVLRGATVAARNAAVTHCPKGHPYDESNTYRPPGRHARNCKRCKLDATARWSARQRRAA